MTAFHIAQFNYAIALYPLDDPRMAGFTDNLDVINRLAEAAPGFVWRLIGDGGDATDVVWHDTPDALVNMTVWTGIDRLFDYVYKTAHTTVMAQRRQWFNAADSAYHVLWWVPAGHLPTVTEASERLQRLNTDGPTPYAFDFKQRFDPTAASPAVAVPAR